MPIRVAFFGNCQAQTLGRVYRDYIAPELDQSVVLLDAQYEHRPQQDVSRLLSQVDIVILQQFDFKSRITADVLKPGARRITFPHVTGSFYWPFGNQHHPKDDLSAAGQTGSYPNELGDRFLNRLIRKGVPIDEAVSQYLALDVAKEASLDRFMELHLERQRVRDQQTGFSVAELIEQRFRDERLFLSQGHPDLPLFKLIAEEVYKRLDAPAALIEQALAAQRVSPFPPHEMPIHPSVIRHFGLKFVNDDTRYRYFHEGQLHLRGVLQALHGFHLEPRAAGSNQRRGSAL